MAVDLMSLMKNPVTEIKDFVLETAKQIFGDKVEKEKIEGKLKELELTFNNSIALAQLELQKAQLEMQKTEMTANAEIIKAQQTTFVADATGASWLQRNWRPVTCLWFAIVMPIVHLFSGGTVGNLPEMYWVITGGLLGVFGISRGVEKVFQMVKKEK